jgi:hypothetical protein
MRETNRQLSEAYLKDPPLMMGRRQRQQSAALGPMPEIGQRDKGGNRRASSKLTTNSDQLNTPMTTFRSIVPGPLGVTGGCRRQADGAAGLPPAPEMPCAPG